MGVKNFKHTITIVAVLFIAISATAQTSVPQHTMEEVFHKIKTSHKYGLVITAPEGKMTDSPSIFRKGNTWYMYYIIFDGRGYETWMATSKNLLEWETAGKVMSFTADTDWDSNQKAGYLSLVDTKWGGSYKIKRYADRYWMSYLGGSSRGYESGTLAVGMAYNREEPTTAKEWSRIEKPVLSPKDKDANWWDNNVIYKSSVIEDKKKLSGHQFVMYYNAKGNAERIGMAVSDDMVNWTRLGSNPVLDHHRGITGDAYIQRMGKLWVMFYFGFGWDKEQSGRAWDSFACSYDLVNWTDWQGQPLIQPSEEFDAQYAHKPCVVKHKGVVYHFYCAVDKHGNRGIALSTSKALGKSKIHFSKR
ncbi:MAG: glycosylase [Alistipes sp.]|nr:glycosylase [Alistipes sp.]